MSSFYPYERNKERYTILKSRKDEIVELYTEKYNSYVIHKKLAEEIIGLSYQEFESFIGSQWGITPQSLGYNIRQTGETNPVRPAPEGCRRVKKTGRVTRKFIPERDI